MKKPWEHQESRLANLTGGVRQPGSGNGWARKNDVRSKGHLIEAKWTSAKSFIIKLAELRQLEHNAVIDSRTPVFCIEFKGRHGTRRYVVLREEDYLEDAPRLASPSTGPRRGR